MELYEDCPRYVRSLAISADAKVLGVSDIFDVEQEKVSFQSPHSLITIEADRTRDTDVGSTSVTMT